jgi:hypothetical protein
MKARRVAEFFPGRSLPLAVRQRASEPLRGVDQGPSVKVETLEKSGLTTAYSVRYKRDIDREKCHNPARQRDGRIRAGHEWAWGYRPAVERSLSLSIVVK